MKMMYNLPMNPLTKALELKKGAEKKLQGFGARIRKNVLKGQEDFKAGKKPYYGSINPFK